MKHFVLAITGASGAVYGLRLAEELLRGGNRLSLLVSAAGFAVLKEECGLDWSGSEDEVAKTVREHFSASPEALSFFAADNWLAPIASGSSAPDAMIVCPCSMGTLSRIATGNSGSLLERAADVMLKEGRPLILVPRETPLNAIHLEHMLTLSRLGVKIVPAMPGFYHKPQTLEDLVDFLVGKLLDLLGAEHALFKRWGDK
ncbi:UbiX family flavin prenyltransferase [Geomonas sp. RF6]|uniref:UbiX family flavin prenyltransferase n=1 Tax=Geomonas sp. RF6 TaxID=2897342 RepID=UPI001E4FB01B|nr:flavin prenyltransferase UbiX [Geomonas sp. RF6]UFS71872.1 UbiX family flavin prenyltransferase [Geomonas sp. RF6]